MPARSLHTLVAALVLATVAAPAPAARLGGSPERTPGCTEVPDPARWADAGTPDTGSADPLVSAHRGANQLAPENTLWAFRYAYAYGAAAVEADVRETADGHYVVLHDDTVDRTTDGTGPVSEMTLAQVKALNAADHAPWKGSEYDPSTIPTVEEVLALARAAGGGVEFDIKSVGDPSRLVDMAAAYGVLEESFFNTADPRVVAGRPEARLIYNRDTGEPPGSLYVIGERYGVFGSRLDEYSAESIAEVHDACGLVVPHTYDRGPDQELAEWEAGRAIGIDGGQTNQPDVAADALNLPVPTRLLRQGPDAVCLVNAENGLGIPQKPLTVGEGPVTTGRGGCVTLEDLDDPVSFQGDGSAQAAGSVEDHPAGAPRGVHLSFTGDPDTTATVMWFTTGLEDPGSSVAFGAAGGPDCGLASLTDQVEGVTSKAPGVDTLTHEATLPGLRPGGRVCYRVGGLSGWSPVRSFHTADEGPFTFTAFGDHGRSDFSRDNTASLAELQPDLHLIAGDLSYANGVQPIWDTWFGELEPLASTVPVMAALGNHEVEDGFGTQAFRNRLGHPGAELYYSFDYANVHFLMVDGGAALEEGILPDELAFVERDLVDAARRRAAGEIDFIIAVQHFPLWSNHDSRGPCDPALVAVEEQIFQRYQVDIVLVGHNHHYERSKPMMYGQPTTQETGSYTDPAGFIQVITGGGGVSLYNFVPPGEFATWSAAYARRYHYTKFEVTDDQITVTAIATDEPTDEVLDTFTLRTEGPSASAPAPSVPNPCP